MIEYWRWWLVHLWVEGFFEVFATAVIALLFTRLGLIREATANSAIVLETIVFLFGGILGTLWGALVIAVLNNGLTLLGVSFFWQLVAKGAVIVLAVGLDRFRRVAN